MAVPSRRKIVINLVIFFIGLIVFVAWLQWFLGVISPSEPEGELKCKGDAMCFWGTVTRVIDGDTIEVDGERIRLSLTNAYELREPGGRAARSFTLSLCPIGSKALVDQDDGQPFDRYGRIVAKVYCSGKNLNAELLYNGHGYILISYCARSEFSNEKWAKEFGC